MVLLRFTKLIDQILDHRKTQTIRLPRKRPWQKGDKLDVYLLMKVGEATLENCERKTLDELTLEDALKDGFSSLEECQICL